MVFLAGLCLAFALTRRKGQSHSFSDLSVLKIIVPQMSSQKNGTRSLSHIETNVNSNWIKGVNVRLQTLILQEENMWEIRQDVDLSKYI